MPDRLKVIAFHERKKIGFVKLYKRDFSDKQLSKAGSGSETKETLCSLLYMFFFRRAFEAT